MITVGCGMIARDCEDTLGICLESIRGLFDDLVVVDTGSTDSTRDVARKYGARVIEHPWVYDFSIVRNASFRELKTDYAAWFDADDILLGQENFEEMVLKCVDMGLDGIILEYLYSFDHVGQAALRALEPDILARRISIDNALPRLMKHCNTTQYRERLVKKIPGWDWHYPVHEALPSVGRRLGKYDKVKVIHRRHVRKNPVSTKRNLEILNMVPDAQRDERIWFYLGLEHAAHGNTEPAIEGFEQHLKRSSVEDERYLSCHFLADLNRSKGDMERALEWDLKAVALKPTWRDAYAGLLETSVKVGDWQKALYFGAMCAKSEIPDTPFAFNPVHEEIGWIGDYMQALLNFGMFNEARQYASKYLEYVPSDVAMLHNLDVISSEMNFIHGVESVSDTIEFFLRNDDAETAALIIARSHPKILSHPQMKKWVALVSSACAPALHGQVLPDVIKVDPKCKELPDYSECAHNWHDQRVQFIYDALKLRPWARDILVIGAPDATADLFIQMGVRATRAVNLASLEMDYRTFDMTVLWSCLERVKYPDRLVDLARQKTRAGGDIIALVPNGPATRGLAPPDQVGVRMRAYSIDTFRQVMGTVKFPHVTQGWPAVSGELGLVVPLDILPRGRRTIAIVCPFSPEKWGPWSLDTGIGGSEEAVIRLSRAFARRGHKVSVYGSGWTGMDFDSESMISYYDMGEYKRSDILIGWRYPEIFTMQMRQFDAEWKVLWLHDTLSKERVAQAIDHVDAVWCISDYHASLFAGLPKIYGGRNGIDPWEFEFERPIARNPNKLVFVSTPFRGLDIILEMWPEIRSRMPEAELHAYYGWESSDRLGSTSTPEGKAFKEKVINLCRQPGVVWRGRIGQPELYKEMASASVLAYSSRHFEESCISVFIAQASGTWPVTTPLGALPQSVVFGWKVELPAYVDTLVNAMKTDDGRDQMAQWARRYLSWDSVASTFERLWLGLPG